MLVCQGEKKERENKTAAVLQAKLKIQQLVFEELQCQIRGMGEVVAGNWGRFWEGIKEGKRPKQSQMYVESAASKSKITGFYYLLINVCSSQTWPFPHP